MNSQRQKQPTPWSLIITFFVISITVIVAGYLYFNYQRDSLLNEKQQELSAICDLKIRQITQWRLERLGDAEFLSRNILMVRAFLDFLNNPAKTNLQSDILQSLKSLTENFDYKNILLLNPEGDIVIAWPNQDSLTGDHLKPLLPQIIKERKVVLTDLHKASFVSYIHLDLIVPLMDQSKNDTPVGGLLAIMVEPQKVLYPLIQSWPTPSKTAETLLFRKENEEIVYLNELRHLRNSELLLRKPVTTEKLPAAMAVQGITGTIDGIDYRNVPVIAAMKKIPGTAWFMVAKIDREEIFLNLNNQLRMGIIIVILFILSLGLLLGFVWWNLRVRFYRQKYEEELDRLALVKHFDYILKFANDIILLIDNDLRIVEANDRALESYMYTRAEFIGMKLENIRAPETLSQLSEQLRKVDEDESATFETYHKRKDDSIFPVEISSRVVNIEGSKYYQTIGRDITERKSAEETLRESEEKFRKIFEESPFSMVMTAKDFGIIKVNSSFCSMTGYSEEELKTFTFRNFTHPEHIGNDEVSLMRLIAGEIPIYQTEKRYIRKDGSIIWGSTTVSIIRNKDGEVQFFLAMVEDITLRKVAEEELEKSFSLQKATLESTADGILVVDSGGRILQYNQKFADMWNIPENVLRLKEDNAAIQFVINQLKNPDSFIHQVRHLYSDPDAVTFDLLEFKDGRFFERYSQPQKIGGNTVGRVWSFRDITEKKRDETELILSKEKAEESDRLKTAFLHNVSHEIRTPMNAIIGFSTLMSEPDIKDQERQQYSDIIFQSSNQLLSIINDIVDIANIESGQVRLSMRETDINSSMLSLHRQFSYKEKQYNIPINVSPGLPDEKSIIITDSTKLIQVLSNLISNSVKFTKKGQIDFGYTLKNKTLEFFVKDTGIGIPKELLSKIFDRFYQVDSAVSRHFGGTGLGLSICKAYVELLGGIISVESEPGKGTRFVFTIPYTPV